MNSVSVEASRVSYSYKYHIDHIIEKCKVVAQPNVSHEVSCEQWNKSNRALVHLRPTDDIKISSLVFHHAVDAARGRE